MSARRIDAHLHLWSLARAGYPWLTPDLGPLYRDAEPAQARVELDAAGVTDAIIVQAEDSVAETRFLLSLAAENPWIAGVVGWAPLDDPAAARATLDEYEGTRVRGIRHLVHDDPRADFLDLGSVRESLALVADAGLAFDVPDAWPAHLAGAARVAADLPDLTVVIDHLAKPPVDADAQQEWRGVLAAVAGRPNTVAKLSGLQRDGSPLTSEVVRPLLDTALELFGASRIMWGSDWPMTLASGGYGPTWAAMDGCLQELSAHERSEILAGTAERTYGC